MLNDRWALWPDGYMCPAEEIEEQIEMGNTSRSDDYEMVTVTRFDTDGEPIDWEVAK